MTAPVHIYDNLKTRGFSAGTILRGAWRNQPEIYDYIKQEFLSSEQVLLKPGQSHRAGIVMVGHGDNAGGPNADGILCRASNICLTVRTADCVPLLLAEPPTGIFGAVHVGWRGFVAGIIEELLALSRALGLQPEAMHCGLGPSVGKCCFETGDEVAALFEESLVSDRDRALFVDLRKAVIDKMIAAGVRRENIDGVDDCTVCLDDKYYSYRRTGDASLQMVSFIFKSK